MSDLDDLETLHLSGKKKRKPKISELYNDIKPTINEEINDLEDNADYDYRYLLQNIYRQHAFVDRKIIITPVQSAPFGSNKTIFINFVNICKQLSRPPEHVMKFIVSELCVQKSQINTHDQLILQGRFKSKDHIQPAIRQYIIEYVQCHACKSTDTTLYKSANGLVRINCGSCQSERTVQDIVSMRISKK